MAEYIPPKADWVRKQVELYESSGGTEGVMLPESATAAQGLQGEFPCIIVTHTGNKTGAIRKIPLMRVKVGDAFVLVGSMGGAPNNPVWVYNLRANPEVEIRDATELFQMRVREVTDDAERQRLWNACVAAYPPYDAYQAKTSRKIPVFIAEPA